MRKISRSVPGIWQKWMATVHIYVESACEESLGCWSKAGAEEGSLLAVQAPSAYILMSENTCCSMTGSRVALFEAWCE